MVKLKPHNHTSRPVFVSPRGVHFRASVVSRRANASTSGVLERRDAAEKQRTRASLRDGRLSVEEVSFGIRMLSLSHYEASAELNVALGRQLIPPRIYSQMKGLVIVCGSAHGGCCLSWTLMPAVMSLD